MECIPVFPSLVDYVRKDAKVCLITHNSLAVRQTLKITAVVKTAVQMTTMSHLTDTVPLHVALKTTQLMMSKENVV